MTRILVAFLFAAAMAGTPASAGDLAGRAVNEVDLHLVLAADNSGSMGATLRDAQRRGFAAAFRDPDLQRAVRSGPVGRIAVTYFEWSGSGAQTVIVPWTVLATADDMARFARALETGHTRGSGGETSISGAMMFADRLFRQSRFVSHRKVVDISGNGRDSREGELATALKALRASGATVNGLVLPDFDSDLDGPYATLFAGHDGPLIDYYRRQVIGGPGAFAIEVDPADGFGGAILRKLVLEIAWVMPGELAR